MSFGNPAKRNTCGIAVKPRETIVAGRMSILPSYVSMISADLDREVVRENVLLLAEDLIPLFEGVEGQSTGLCSPYVRKGHHYPVVTAYGTLNPSNKQIHRVDHIRNLPFQECTSEGLFLARVAIENADKPAEGAVRVLGVEFGTAAGVEQPTPSFLNATDNFDATLATFTDQNSKVNNFLISCETDYMLKFG